MDLSCLRSPARLGSPRFRHRSLSCAACTPCFGIQYCFLTLVISSQEYITVLIPLQPDRVSILVRGPVAATPVQGAALVTVAMDATAGSIWTQAGVDRLPDFRHLPARVQVHRACATDWQNPRGRPCAIHSGTRTSRIQLEKAALGPNGSGHQILYVTVYSVLFMSTSQCYSLFTLIIGSVQCGSRSWSHYGCRRGREGRGRGGRHRCG